MGREHFELVKCVSIVAPITREFHQQQLLRSIQSLAPAWLDRIIFVTPADNGGDANRNCLRNIGWRQAESEFVLMMDEDTRLTSRATVAVARFLNASEAPIVLLSGPYGDDPQSSFWGRIYNRICNLWLVSAPAGERFLAGAVLLRKQAVPDSLKETLFNESLCSGGEEDELFQRIKSLGLKGSYDVNFSVLHQSRHSLSSMQTRLRGHLQTGRRRGPVLTRRALTQLLTSPMLWLGLVVDMKSRLVKDK